MLPGLSLPIGSLLLSSSHSACRLQSVPHCNTVVFGGSGKSTWVEMSGTLEEVIVVALGEASIVTHLMIKMTIGVT